MLKGLAKRLIRLFLRSIFRAIPRRWRFQTAVRLARALRPLVARTGAYAARVILRTDGLAESSLAILLEELTRGGVEYEPLFEIDGIENDLHADAGHPWLLVGAHMMLSPLYLRHLSDRGVGIGVISADTEMRVPGTHVRVDVIQAPSNDLLFEVRRRLRGGGIVGAMVDRDLIERRTSEFGTVNGGIIVSKALFQLALRKNARVVFIGSRMGDDDRIVITLRGGTESTAEGLAAEFAAFIDQLLSADVTSRTSRPRRSSDRTTAIRG